MAGAGVIATQLTDQSSVAYRLTLDGLDFLERGGAFGVPIESIRVVEEGPGGVSSMSFVINDPDVEATFTTTAWVEFWDVTNDRPLFAGWVQNIAIRPTAVGRTIVVDCVGIEAVLDWMTVPYLQIFTDTHLAAGVQAIIANATGVNVPLRALSQPSGSEDYGSQEYPIAGATAGFPATEYEVIIEGQSVREAIAQLVIACNTWETGGGAYLSIDFYSGVRLYIGDPGTGNGILFAIAPSDFDALHYEMSGGIQRATVVDFSINPGGVVRGVYIQGGIPRTTGYDPIGSGLVSDGSGIPGPVAFISDDTSTTDAIRDTIGQDYLGQQSQSVRGSLRFEPVDASELAFYNYRPGGRLTYEPDAQVMGELTFFTIFSISKSWRPVGVEDWTVSFGGFAPSATKQTRRLTRTTRS